MQLRRWLVCGSAAAVLAALAVEGCGSSPSSYPDNVCGSPNSCSVLVAPTTAQLQQCTLLLDDPTCGQAFKAMKECQTYRSKCRSSGAFDSSATNAACAVEIAAHSQCLGMQPTDGGTTDSCRRRTCSQANANCGEVDDGCGGKITCGTCTNGQTCGGGTPNRCGCSCDPTWCGTVAACGTTITCPSTCPATQSCGGGGISNRCGCLPSGSIGPMYAVSVTASSFAIDGGTQSTWSSATNARASDNSYASSTLVAGSTTQYLVALSYGFALPANAIVEGIEVGLERSTSQGLATADHAVYLVKNTQIQTAGENKAGVGTWPAAETTVSYGGATDKWGNTWTAADINAGFGVAFAARYTGQTGSEQARVDAISVKIHYSGVVCQ